MQQQFLDKSYRNKIKCVYCKNIYSTDQKERFPICPYCKKDAYRCKYCGILFKRNKIKCPYCNKLDNFRLVDIFLGACFILLGIIAIHMALAINPFGVVAAILLFFIGILFFRGHRFKVVKDPFYLR